MSRASETAVATLMESFLIEGGHRLSGTVRAAGNKNGALPILAACLLTREPVTLTNVPRIRDVDTMVDPVVALGAEVSWTGANEVRVHAADVESWTPDERLCSMIRASFLLTGPLLARFGRATMPPPGGDVIGRRRLDPHMHAFAELGAEVELGDRYELVSDGLRGTNIFLDEASVMATENTIMRTDHIEVGSFIGLAVVTGGDVTIEDAEPTDLRSILMAFERLGVQVEVGETTVRVPSHQQLVVQDDLGGMIPKIEDGPWPAFPADLTSIALTVATQAFGTVLIFEKMFESRLFFTDKLVAMGARIILCDPHRAVITGPARLVGQRMESPDIRAGMAMLLAALCADGQSTIGAAHQIDKGYERIDERLRALGARIERVQA